MHMWLTFSWLQSVYFFLSFYTLWTFYTLWIEQISCVLLHFHVVKLEIFHQIFTNCVLEPLEEEACFWMPRY